MSVRGKDTGLRYGLELDFRVREGLLLRTLQLSSFLIILVRCPITLKHFTKTIKIANNDDSQY